MSSQETGLRLQEHCWTYLMMMTWMVKPRMPNPWREICQKLFWNSPQTLTQLGIGQQRSTKQEIDDLHAITADLPTNILGRVLTRRGMMWWDADVLDMRSHMHLLCACAMWIYVVLYTKIEFLAAIYIVIVLLSLQMKPWNVVRCINLPTQPSSTHIPPCPSALQPSYQEGCDKAAVHSMDLCLETPLTITNNVTHTCRHAPSSHVEDS